VVGDPRDARSNLGPVVSEIQFNKIQRLIQSGIDEGADLVIGGVGRPEGLNRGYYNTCVPPCSLACATT
jgi:aldehyde dehydrogenase (NAD+)